MKITRFTEEQIIAAIRSQVSGEKTVERVSRELGISQATFFKEAVIRARTGIRCASGRVKKF